eukprot:365566-Chlamydomonas_euryale.AAC.8
MTKPHSLPQKLLDFLDGKADLQLEAPGEPLGAAAQPAVAEEEQPAAKRARTEGAGCVVCRRQACWEGGGVYGGQDSSRDSEQVHSVASALQ